jgi:ABC-type uncharacterized transport system fused permease/ATPase subunit
MFLSQKPYLPGGSLRDALYYPATPPQGNGAELEQVLHTIQLGHLQSGWMKNVTGATACHWANSSVWPLAACC